MQVANTTPFSTVFINSLLLEEEIDPANYSPSSQIATIELLSQNDISEIALSIFASYPSIQIIRINSYFKSQSSISGSIIPQVGYHSNSEDLASSGKITQVWHLTAMN